MRQLSSADWTMVALDTSTAHNTIGIVGIYDPSTRSGSRDPVTYEEVLKYIDARLHVAESFRERLVLLRHHPVRGALKDMQLAGPPGDWRHQLRGRGAGADDAHAFAGEIHRRVRPPRRAVQLAREAREMLDVGERHLARGEGELLDRRGGLRGARRGRIDRRARLLHADLHRTA